MLGMFVTDNHPTHPNTPGYLRNNIDEIKRRIAYPGLQTLKKSLDGVFWRQIDVEVKNVATFNPVSHETYNLAITFSAPYPYWRASSITSRRMIGRRTRSEEMTGIWTNSSTAPVEDATITITDVAYPRLEWGYIWFQYHGDVLGLDKKLVVYCGDWRAEIVEGGATKDVSHLISHGGDPRWMVIPPGSSSWRLTGDAFGDNVSLSASYFNRYL